MCCCCCLADLVAFKFGFTFLKNLFGVSTFLGGCSVVVVLLGRGLENFFAMTLEGIEFFSFTELLLNCFKEKEPLLEGGSKFSGRE